MVGLGADQHRNIPKMRRQRAFHLIVSATIALGIGDGVIVAVVAESRGGPSSSSSSPPSLGGGGGRRPTSRSSSFARGGRLPGSLSLSTPSSSGRDGLRSASGAIGGRGPGLSQSSSRRRGARSDDVADLDELDFGLNDNADADSLTRDAVDDGAIDRMLEDFEYEMGGMMEDDDDFDLEDRLLDGGTEGEEGYPFEGKEDDSDGEYGQGSEKGALYDAYNLLHSLAQVRNLIHLVSNCLIYLSFVSHGSSAHSKHLLPISQP